MVLITNEPYLFIEEVISLIGWKLNVRLGKAMVFPVVMYGCWELDCEGSWVPKNWHFWTVVLEKTLESPLNCKKSQPVHPKGNLSWIFIGRTDAEAETPILWPPDAKNWLIGKEPDAGKDWRHEEKGMTGWGGWMASLTQWTWVWASSERWCYSPWGGKELDTTEWLNWTEKSQVQIHSYWTLCAVQILQVY